MAETLKIVAWGILSGVFVALSIFLLLTRKVKSGRARKKSRSLSELVLIAVFSAGLVGMVYYFLLLFYPNQGESVVLSISTPFNWKYPVVNFPLTGTGPASQTIIESIKGFYATPVDGLVTSFLLVSIVFLSAFLIKDITDRKKIEDDLERARIAARNVLDDLQVERVKLAEAKAKDEAMLASIGDGVIIVDPAGKIILMNQSAQNMLGWKSAEVMGELLFDIVPVEDENGVGIPDKERAMAIALVARAITGIRIIAGAARDAEISKISKISKIYYYVRKDKTKFPVAVTAASVILEDKIIGAIEVFRDITKEREIDRAKTEFISIASHQLRTPVSGLSWLTEALQFTSKNLNPKQKKYVEDLAMLSKRLVGLVEDLLNISRVELKTELVTEKTQVDVPSFIEEFIKEIEPYANSKKHTIAFNKNITDPLVVRINKKSLYNVFQNLVSNAIEYSPENTAVTINLEMDGQFIKTSIFNKGQFIPKDEQGNLFQRFYRAKSAKNIKAEGTGLGLYIVKMIIEEMGGRVGFESEEGSDTFFWFTIPCERSNKKLNKLAK